MIRRWDDIKQAGRELQLGRVLAYPTEAVYGLGCDPFNRQAVERILAIKGRAATKGMIILIADWSQLSALIAAVTASRLAEIQASWPGPITWVFPKSSLAPAWVCHEDGTIAIRMTAHPIAKQLCELGPIVSTSANPQGQKPARTLTELDCLFPEGLDGVVMGALGTETQPSAIYEALTGKRLR